MSTLARLERLLTLVPWLLEHPGSSVAEVAERFGVPAGELLRDLDLLGYCGIPGYGGGDLIEVTLVDGRVTLRMADYFRRPLRLSLREAVTLLLAARAFAAVDGLAAPPALDSAIRKLEQLLSPGGPPEVAPRLVVDLSAPGQEHLAVLRDAVAGGRVVHLTYRSASKAETTERDVEPWALVAAQGAWYLQGHCRLAGGPRDFRLDRIRRLTVTEERLALPLPAPPGPPVYEPGVHDVVVVLDLLPDGFWLSEWAVTERVEDSPGRRRVWLRTPELGWAARLVLRLGGAAAVVEPPELAREVRRLAGAALDRYR